MDRPDVDHGTVAGASLCTAAMFAVGSSVAFSSVLTGYPVLAGETGRYLLAGVVLLRVMRTPGLAWIRPTAREFGYLCALAAVGLAGFNVLLIAAALVGETRGPTHVGLRLPAERPPAPGGCSSRAGSRRPGPQRERVGSARLARRRRDRGCVRLLVHRVGADRAGLFLGLVPVGALATGLVLGMVEPTMWGTVGCRKCDQDPRIPDRCRRGHCPRSRGRDSVEP
jgi:hypothetical protein